MCKGFCKDTHDDCPGWAREGLGGGARGVQFRRSATDGPEMAARRLGKQELSRGFNAWHAVYTLRKDATRALHVAQQAVARMMRLAHMGY